MIYGARIDMNCLKRNFSGLDADSIEVQREQHTQAYVFMIIGGLLMPNKSRNLVHLRWLLKLVDFREEGKLSWGSAVLNNRYEFLLTHEAIIALKLACDLEYMPWFRVYGKSYLLVEEARGRQLHTRRAP
ncbi:hypothetical protein CXB51_035459 [Gossypium anomalum]|uniref:Aminotransferase-like plant mobile domain-containing protein n=1 Tax=Gossypium anomalum TaxID=47600 RepID=A0A8J6CFQ1_9ROSI|nr:hypothetical protein CXB51_035459 [Gossypium anomalum]